MIFSDLQTIIQDYQPYIHSVIDENAEIYGAFPYLRNDHFQVESNILYVVNDDSFKGEGLNQQKQGDIVINLLIIGNHEDFSQALGFTKANIIFAEKVGSIDTLFAKIMKNVALDSSIHDKMRILTNALFDNKGVQHIINVGHSIVENPIFLQRSSDRTLIYACNDEDLKNSKCLQKVINDVDANRQKLKNQVLEKFLFQDEIIEELRSSNLTYKRYYNENLQCEQLTCIVKVRRLEVAFLTIVATRQAFDDLTESMIWRVSVLIGQELQKKTLYSRNRNEVKAQFVHHLLSAKNVSEQYIYEVTRIKNIVALGSQFYVAVVEASANNPDYDSKTFDMIAELLQPILRNSFYLIREAELVILFNLTADTNIHNLIDDFLVRYTSKGDYIVGISNRFTKLVDTKFYYNQAKKAIHLSQRYENWQVCYFSDMMPIEALHVINRNEDLLNFCTPEVLELLEYDKENNSDLVTTLWVYLENFGNTSKSASQLYIHKNTLLYRISKIKDILKNDLDSGEEIFKISMSLRVLRILRMYVLPKELDNVPPRSYVLKQDVEE